MADYGEVKSMSFDEFKDLYALTAEMANENAAGKATAAGWKVILGTGMLLVLRF